MLGRLMVTFVIFGASSIRAAWVSRTARAIHAAEDFTSSDIEPVCLRAW